MLLSKTLELREDEMMFTNVSAAHGTSRVTYRSLLANHGPSRVLDISGMLGLRLQSLEVQHRGTSYFALIYLCGACKVGWVIIE